MVIDVVTFNGEYDLLEIRYNMLKDYVDKFVVIEFDKTFSGKPKESYIVNSDKYFYTPIDQWDKVHCAIIGEEIYNKYLEEAEQSKYTVGAEHWKREYCQKESIKDVLEKMDIRDDDIVFIGDVDEIWDDTVISSEWEYPEVLKLKLDVYTYYLNNKSSEEFFGPVVGYWKQYKGKCLNEIRNTAKKTMFSYGWHFTSLKDNLQQKLKDSYTEETYATQGVLNNLEDNITKRKDFLGRDFTMTIDESKLPQYLLDNKEKYKHLFYGA